MGVTAIGRVHCTQFPPSGLSTNEAKFIPKLTFSFPNDLETYHQHVDVMYQTLHRDKRAAMGSGQVRLTLNTRVVNSRLILVMA